MNKFIGTAIVVLGLGVAAFWFAQIEVVQAQIATATRLSRYC